MVKFTEEEKYGILTFNDHYVSEDQIAVQKFDELIAEAKQSSCLDALSKHGFDVNYVTDARRSTYLGILDIEKSDDVLEIGSSLGQHTHLIAKKCKSLSSIEVDLQQASFQKIWCKEEGLRNVRIVAGGLGGRLPYEDASFDFVVFNYVLEWCAGSSNVDRAAFHQTYLKEIFRVLRPGGTLYLSTKNRFSIRYVLGSMDEHLGIRFGSALPRFLQKIFTKRNTFIGYLHSLRGLEHIVAEAGFASSKRIMAFPDARYSDIVVPLEKFESRLLSAAAISKLPAKTRLSLYFGKNLFRQTSNSIVLLATK